MLEFPSPASHSATVTHSAYAPGGEEAREPGPGEIRMKSDEQIKIVRIQLSPDDGRPLRARVDIQIGDLVIYDWRIIKQSNQRAQVSVPQISWRDREGRVRYRELMTMPGELKQRIDVQILAAWQKEIDRGRMDQTLPKTS